MSRCDSRTILFDWIQARALDWAATASTACTSVTSSITPVCVSRYCSDNSLHSSVLISVSASTAKEGSCPPTTQWVSIVLRLSRNIIGCFRDEPFLAVNCTCTVNWNQKNNTCTGQKNKHRNLPSLKETYNYKTVVWSPSAMSDRKQCVAILTTLETSRKS